MCRIAYIPSTEGLGIKVLSDLFAYLEKKQGGDGNGLAYYDDADGALCYVGGVEQSSAHLASLASVCVGPVLFHTRLASSGGVMDALCQPIIQDGVAFAHNGTWHGWPSVAQELIFAGKLNANYPINDSVTAAAMAIEYGRYSLETIKAGVFVLMEDGVAKLHLRTGVFRWSRELGIYASDFETGVDSESIADNSIATLCPDGPEFECGGYYKASAVRTFLAGTNVHGSSYHPDNVGKRWNQDTKVWEEVEGEPEETTQESSAEEVSQKALWELDDQTVCDGCPDQDSPPCYANLKGTGWEGCPYPLVKEANNECESGSILEEMRRILGEERAGGPKWADTLSDQTVRLYYYQDHEEPPNPESPGRVIGAAACRKSLDLSDEINISDEDVMALYDEYRQSESGDLDVETMRKLLVDHLGDQYATNIEQLSDEEVLVWFTDVENGALGMGGTVTAQDIRNEMLAVHGAVALGKMTDVVRQLTFDRRCELAGIPPCKYKQEPVN